MGGDAQPGVHVQLLAHLVDDDADPAAALAAPRWRVDPGTLARPRRIALRVARSPTRSGPSGTTSSTHPAYDADMGHAHVIRVDPSGGYTAAADPRSEGLALGR